MKIVFLKKCAFITTTAGEVQNNKITVEAKNIAGEAITLKLLLRERGSLEEKSFEINGGFGTFPVDALRSDAVFVVTVVVDGKRYPAGEIKACTDDAGTLGIYAIRDSAHLWCAMDAVLSLIGETKNKVDAHIDGTYVI